MSDTWDEDGIDDNEDVPVAQCPGQLTIDDAYDEWFDGNLAAILDGGATPTAG